VPASAHRALAAKALLTGGADGERTTAVAGLAPVAMRLSDGPNGVDGRRYDERDPSACTPCGSALAATWDVELVTRVGDLIGREAQAKGVHVVLGPVLNLARSPLGGRVFESFGEEPYLAGAIGAAWIAGVQARGVAAAPKHFVGNDAETSRTRVDCVIDERALREVYLSPFEHVLKRGAWAVMASYNAVNGVRMHEHAALLRDVLRSEWGWDGVVISDWFGVTDTVRSATAGVDLEMPGPARHFGSALADAVAAGRVDAAAVDVMARRVLHLAERVGCSPQRGRAAGPPPPAEAAGALLRDSAAAGFVLLHDDGGLLPLSAKTVRRIAVIGPAAADPCIQGGGSSRVTPRDVVTPLDGLRARFGAEAIRHAPGCSHQNQARSLHGLQVEAQGRPGVLVEYFPGADARSAVAEHRTSSSLIWALGTPAVPGTGRIRLSSTVTPSVSGRHRFMVRGSHPVTLGVAGAGVASLDPPQIAGDPWSALYADAGGRGEAALQAGVPVELVAEMAVAPSSFRLLSVGCDPPEPGDAMDRAVVEAAAADAVVLVVGTTEELESESIDRPDLHLPGRQEELVRRVVAANPSTVVVMNAGAQVDLAAADGAAAVLLAWLPGEAFGAALAAVLSGDREPGGRLPFTVARRAEDHPALDTAPGPDGALVYDDSVLVGHRGFDAAGIEPAYPFGHGLGYTRFAFESLVPSRTALRGGEGLDAEVRIRNVGARHGKAVVQLYAAPPRHPAPQPVRRLAGFAAVTLAAGECRTVSIPVAARAFSHWSPARRAWVATPGCHTLHAGSSSRDLPLSAEISMLPARG
jgi:beta-glucosidase